MSKHIGSGNLIQSMTISKSFHYLNHLSISYIKAAALQGQALVSNTRLIAAYVLLWYRQHCQETLCWNSRAKPHGKPALDSALKVSSGDASSLSQHLSSAVLAPGTRTKANTSPAPGSRMPAGLCAGSASTAAKRFQHPPLTLPKAPIRSCKSIKSNH